MTKEEFLDEIKKELGFMPYEEVDVYKRQDLMCLLKRTTKKKSKERLNTAG